MAMKLTQSIPSKIFGWLQLPRMADITALCGILLFLMQAVNYAHTTIPSLDEGGYLVKGWLFSTGEYRPFEPGISTNKSPLAFLIPGYVQLIFGPGLQTGRYLAVLFGVLAVFGVWLSAKRLSNHPWLAAGAVWALALNSPTIKIYSMAVTQSTIAFMMAWSLALVLGERRKVWELILGGALAGAMMMVRQNMVPVLPLLAIYAVWQHKWRGLWFGLSGTVFAGYFFYVYWPMIAGLWNFVPFLPVPDEAIYRGGGSGVWNPEVSFSNRILSFFQAIRLHFVAFFGSLMVIFLWKTRNKRESDTRFVVAITLFLLFWGLMFMHMIAAVGLDYCVFCLKNYVAFFNVVGLLLVIVSISSWNWSLSRVSQFFVYLLSLAIISGISFSAFEEIGDLAIRLPVPRFRDGQIIPSLTTLGDVFIYGLGFDLNLTKRFSSLLFGVLLACVLMTVFYWVWKKNWRSAVSFGYFVIMATLVLGGAIGPLLGGVYTTSDCKMDIIAADAVNGLHLQNIIPPGSSVYWDGGLSAVPLLHLSDVTIYPAQINGGYSFLSQGDTQELQRFGYWNEEMRDIWKRTSDFIIVEEQRYGNWQAFLTPAEFDEFPHSPEGTSCQEGTRLRIFKRK